MPRGVYKRAIKKATASSTFRKAKKTTARRPVSRPRRRKHPEDILTITTSQLKSSLSGERTPDDDALVSVIRPTPAADCNSMKESHVGFALYGGDNEDGVEWDSCIDNEYDNFDEAAERAKGYAVERSEPVFIVQVVGVAEVSDVVIKRAAPKF